MVLNPPDDTLISCSVPPSDLDIECFPSQDVADFFPSTRVSEPTSPEYGDIGRENFILTRNLMKPSPSSSESGSSDSLSVHFAPLSLRASNEGAFERLTRHRITQPVVGMLNVCNQFRVERLTFTADHLVNRVSEAVDVGLMSSPSSPSSQPSSCLRKHPKFTAFVVNVLSEADVTMSVILTTLLYVTRSKPHLRIPVDEWALERVFLGALIIASKVLLFLAFFPYR